MKKISLFLVMMVVANLAYAENTSRIKVQGTIDDGVTKFEDTGTILSSFTTGVVQIQSITATASAFTNIPVPTGAKAVLLAVGSEDQNLVLKGVTCDVGISLDSVCPLLMPISADNVTFGVKNMSSTARTMTVYWF